MRETTIWDTRYQEWRRMVMSEEPLCRMCKAEGLHVAAAELDHVVPRSKGGALMDRSNVQPLCLKHHRAKSATEKKPVFKKRVNFEGDTVREEHAKARSKVRPREETGRPVYFF